MEQLPPIQYHEITVARSAVDVDLLFFESIRGRGKAAFFAEMETHDKTLRNAWEAIHDYANTQGTVGADKLRVLEGLAKAMPTLRRYIGLAKLPAALDIIEAELAEGKIGKIVLFAIHKDVIEAARVRLKKFKPVTLYGGTPADKRQLHIDRFMREPQCRVFIGNIQAAGTGITLTSAHEVAFLEADWVPANNAQAAMRCHRIGQEHPVRVRFFSLAGSIDEKVMATLRNKTRELTKIF